MKKILIIFIEIITIIIAFSKLCGINPPQSPDYCGNYLDLTSESRCCYCSHNNNINKKLCILLENVVNIPQNILHNNYTCDCESVLVNNDLPGAPCLNESITKTLNGNFVAEYCHGLSRDEKHPCCYYDDGIEKRCFSIGKITSETLYTYSDFLDCLSNYHKISFLLILVILLVFFNF